MNRDGMTGPLAPVEAASEAREILAGSLVVEGHRDCYEQIHRLNQGETNPVKERLYPRLLRGNVSVTFYAVGGDTIAHSNGTDRPLFATLQNMDSLSTALSDPKVPAEILLSAADLPERPEGVPRFILHLEGGAPLEGSLSSLRSLYRLGVRSAQLTWNVRNDLGDGVLEERTGGGLTRFGADVVREMNRLCMLVDLAHIAEPGFWHAIEVSQSPVAVTHANARGLLDHPRNLTDAQLRSVAQMGGVVGVHCLPAYVDPDDPTLDRLIDHICYIADITGIEHVGIGADFPTNDGPRPPREQRFPRKREQLDELHEIDDLEVLVTRLLDRGFRRSDIAAVLGGNFVRLLRDVLA